MLEGKRSDGRTGDGLVQIQTTVKAAGMGYKYGTHVQTLTELGNEPKAWVDRGFFYGSTLAKHARNPHVDCGYLLP